MKSKTSLRAAARQAIHSYPKLFVYWRPLLAVHIVSYLLAEALSWEQEAVLNSGKEDLLPIFLVFTGSTVVDVACTALWITVVVKAMQSLASNQSLTQNFFGDLNSALIESTRALARMLRWLPLLIVPGVVKFVRLTFVPFIAVDQAAYKQGFIDALNESERITKNRFFLVSVALFVALVIPSLPSLLLQGENISLASRPLLSITWSVFEFFTSLLATSFLFCLYRQLVSEANLQKVTGVENANL